MLIDKITVIKVQYTSRSLSRINHDKFASNIQLYNPSKKIFISARTIYWNEILYGISEYHLNLICKT